MSDSFKIDQRVIHCREGLCVIVSETNINGNEYFVVKSETGSGENIYVLKTRTDNIIRPIMNVEQAKELVAFMAAVKPEFMTNTKQRRDFYKKKLGSGSVYDLAFLARQLFLFHDLNSKGTLVKLGPTDIEMLEYADKVLYDELCLAFDKNIAEIRDFVCQMLISY